MRSAAEELVTYVAIAFCEEYTILDNLLQHTEEMRQSVKKLVRINTSAELFYICIEYHTHSLTQTHIQDDEIAAITKVVKNGFSIHDGPFVKGLDAALQSFHVHRQQYFGGTFVGIHIHKILQVHMEVIKLTKMCCNESYFYYM